MKLREAVGAFFVKRSIVISPKDVYNSTDISYNYKQNIRNQYKES